MGRSKLQAKGLTKRYGKREVVKDFSLQVISGQVVGLLGPNGAGKTTTFSMLVGLIPCDEGRVELDGENITRLPMYLRAQRGLAYLPQEPSVFRRLNVRENLQAVLEFKDFTPTQRKKKIDKAIEEFGLSKVEKSPGYALSGGERRRVEIARALILEPKFFLLDEPFAGIDPIAIKDIQGLIVGLKDRGLGVIVTDHNVRETLKTTDYAFILSDGVLLTEGTPQALAKDKVARQTYLGEDFKLD